MVKKKIDYSFWIGLKKTTKNIVITWVIPGIALLANNDTEWVPVKYAYPVGMVIAFVSYMIKNWHKNK